MFILIDIFHLFFVNLYVKNESHMCVPIVTCLFIFTNIWKQIYLIEQKSVYLFVLFLCLRNVFLTLESQDHNYTISYFERLINATFVSISNILLIEDLGNILHDRTWFYLPRKDKYKAEPANRSAASIRNSGRRMGMWSARDLQRSKTTLMPKGWVRMHLGATKLFCTMLKCRCIIWHIFQSHGILQHSSVYTVLNN